MRINKFTKLILHYLGLNALARLFLKHKIYALSYHSVSSPETNDEFNADLYKNLSIKKDRFESHIKFLKNKGHTFVNLNDISSSDLKNINKPTIIYFDDGFKDNIKNALPILKKYGVKATVFITTNIADGNSTLWTIKHRAYLKSVGVKKEEWGSVIGELKMMNKIDREQRLSADYDRSSFVWDDKNSNLFLNWEDVKTLLGSGVEIGSHSISHHNLFEIDENLITKELKESKELIENKIGKTINSFSYPYGRGNSDINKILKNLDYEVVVSNGPGLNNLDSISNKFIVLKTVPVKINDDVLDLGAKLYARYFLRS
jgi:peptidoglycan/xylan/chitin deacetylase (PgdA/CDA1 family)